MNCFQTMIFQGMKPGRWMLFALLLSCLLPIFPQALIAQLSTADSLLFRQAEMQMLKGHRDSAKAALEQMSDLNQLKKAACLHRILTEKEVNFEDWEGFIDGIGSRPNLSLALYSSFIGENLPRPTNSEELNYHYVRARSFQIVVLRNEARMEEASAVYSELDAYVSQFDPEDMKTRLARARIDVHPIVLAQIQKDLEKGIALCEKMQEVGKQAKDTLIWIGGLYHMAQFCVIQGDLEKFIAVNQECFELNQKLQKPSLYLGGILTNLLNGLIFQGGNHEQIHELFAIMNKHKLYRQDSYSLYAQYLGTLDLDAPQRAAIFQQFDVSNIVDFSEKVVAEGEPKLDPNAMLHLLREVSRALAKSEEYDLALHYKDKSIHLTKKIYAEDLSKALAKSETELAVKAKQIEIDNEKEQSKLYGIIAGLAGLMLIVFVIGFVRQRQQSKKLAVKNAEVEKQRDEIAEREEEKAMLLKEVHHRVKNNFQIISSLLELQTKGIEDTKARELAEEGKNRVKSMALIHQRLYQNDDLLIYFDEYLDKLVGEISDMYGAEDGTNISLNIPKYAFDIDTAIPLGLIVNELVTNAFKYGFGENEKQLNISIKEAGEHKYELTVADNGAGLPENFDVTKAKSLGLRLVRRLAQQLQGSVSYTFNNGSSFVVSFKDTVARDALV